MAIDSKLKKAFAELNELYRLEKKGSLKRIKIYWKKVAKFSVKLSSVLPSVPDSSIYEIYDLVFPGSSKPVTTPEKNFKILKDGKFVYSFLELFFEYAKTFDYSSEPMNANIFTAFLQMISNSDNNNYIYNTVCFIDKLLETRNMINTCQALMVLKIVLLKSEKYLNSFVLFQEDKVNVYWLFTWKNIPQGVHEDKKRILTWMKQQVDDIIPKLLRYETFKKFQETIMMTQKLLEEGKLEEYIKVVTSIKSPFHLKFIEHHNDSVYEYFMSARNEKEKRERMELFIKWCLEATQNWCPFKYTAVMQDIEYRRGYRDPNMVPFRLRFSTFISKMIFGLGIFLRCQFHYQEIQDYIFKEIDQSKACVFKPYLSNNSTETVNNSSDKSTNQDFIFNGHDFSFEKHFIYDDLMKRMRVLNILVTAFRECSDFLMPEGITELDEGSIFRMKETQHFKRVWNRGLYTFRETRLWHMDLVIVKKCPFLMLPKYQEHLLDNLIKYINFEKQDKSIEEELHFVLRKSEFERAK